MNDREYPCPECDTGQLYDANAGGMFAKDIQCDNPECNFGDLSDFIGCTGGE